jgi:AbrB family looped-hinge helix DNA binding protein
MNARAKMSSKGQIVVPKSIRDAHGWDEGTEFEFEDDGNKILLKPVDDLAGHFPPISLEEFRARRIKIDRFLTDKEIEEALLAEAARRFDVTRS